MTDPVTPPSEPPPQSPEELSLRARPIPITRISRKAVIGAAGLLLLVIAGLIVMALRPPTWRAPSPNELVNVDRKPITDGLSRLPSTYDGVRADRPDRPKAGELRAAVPQLETSTGAENDPERAEKARIARMAGQARESSVFFRLQAKSASVSRPAALPRPDSIARPALSADADPASLIALGAAERARALAYGDIGSTVTDATDQTRKLAFLRSGADDKIYNPHALQRPVSPYQVMAGTIIAASLVSGLNSDLPGFVIAQVTEHVHDTVTGRHVLIPQGSRLVGRYDSVVAFGQERALVVWQRIIRPDGTSIVIDNLPATDTSGYAGLVDEVDQHTWKIVKGIALSTLLGIGNQLAFANTDSDLLKALRESTGQTTNRAGQRIVERSLNVQPTITVRPGWPLRVIVHKDLVLTPYRDPSAK